MRHYSPISPIIIHGYCDDPPNIVDHCYHQSSSAEIAFTATIGMLDSLVGMLGPDSTHGVRAADICNELMQLKTAATGEGSVSYAESLVAVVVTCWGCWFHLRRGWERERRGREHGRQSRFWFRGTLLPFAPEHGHSSVQPPSNPPFPGTPVTAHGSFPSAKTGSDRARLDRKSSELDRKSSELPAVEPLAPLSPIKSNLGEATASANASAAIGVVRICAKNENHKSRPKPPTTPTNP